ncbi:hypothetical protein [Deinococcus wulumuqiensis]|uniref:Uncharacterized protein n=1 Tax=Deinococcus wulumuqiensis TaxID=980427 RepID=A0AAV4KEH2_9DEIO|nr:hypothetical protein [Deinococcus wulumuqiensis]GGI95235.1 hypothetical protein GCM10010914_32150 [Deinococcus wulumuqiensis]GGP30021.1 hypothetical protein GCM10008021_16720 [Deinococcus wulumuqiensis]
MPSTKKLASLRLDHDVMDEIDAVMLRFYGQMGGVAPSRNAQLEAWVMEGLERMKARVQEKGEQKG